MLSHFIHMLGKSDSEVPKRLHLGLLKARCRATQTQAKTPAPYFSHHPCVPSFPLRPPKHCQLDLD